MGETFRPASLDQLRDVVAWAVSEEATLAVSGNGSKAGFGRPVDAAHQLETAGLTGVDMYEPEELVMSAGAGTPLTEIEDALAKGGQQLAFEPADYGAILGGTPGAQTIGGVFACNLAGPRRLMAGAARDHLLGLNVVTGHGQVVKAGGRVVKNVTGYDLCKLIAGSFGTLAVMSHVTFKVLPAPEDETTVALVGDDVADLLGRLRRATGTAFEVSGAALLPPASARRSAVGAVSGAGGAVACLRLEGSEPSVAYRADRLEQAVAGAGVEAARLGRDDSRSLWREIRDVALLDTAAPTLWRLSVPPTDAAALTATLDGDWLADWAGGLIWHAGGTARPALPSGGHATLVKAPPDLRQGDVFEPQPAPLRALTKRVKDSFDPKHVLNPGRLYADV